MGYIYFYNSCMISKAQKYNNFERLKGFSALQFMEPKNHENMSENNVMHVSSMILN